MERGLARVHSIGKLYLRFRQLIHEGAKFLVVGAIGALVTFGLANALHDIGKIKVPEEVLNKPGKLTDEEWKLMKAHTVDGDAILSHAELDQNSNFARTARSICRWHHEKYDGKGYPDGLKGDEIPIAAQVVSLADAYDALTSERCYKKAFTHEKAMEMLLNDECGVFNPLLSSV